MDFHVVYFARTADQFMIAQTSRDNFHRIYFLGFITANDINQGLGFACNSRSIVVVEGLDVNHYPTRNSGPTRRYVRVAVLPPALKCLAGLRLANITLCASYLVLLAGDIQQNPGPAKNYCCS